MKPTLSVLPSGRLLPNPGRSPEAELLDHAERLTRSRSARLACWVHLSLLEGRNRREHHLRVAADLFQAALRTLEGRVFVLSCGDLVFVSRQADTAPIDQAVQRLRFLFAEDALVLRDGGRSFCTWYRLERDLPRFLAQARDRQELAGIAGGPSEDEPASEGAPLIASQLAGLEDMLARADLSNFLRNQSVCAIFPGQAPSRVFDEVYVSTRHLAEAVLPGVDLTANPWLFQVLTRTLDRRVLAHMARSPRETPFSLNLNVATLLSPEFRRFDETLNGRLRGRMVIELQTLDVFADMGAFLFARDLLRERGHRICLDGLTHLTLPFVDRARLGFDLVKLRWAPEIAEGRGELAQDIRRFVAENGQANVILGRCDGAAAIETGRAAGISLFQGRHVERLARGQRPGAA
ncbi:EAL domain-containing protein [Arenibaculum pallidiluteum]|uniref:EAL domain-containing protein n=1 Tax=Arenibaculum pallidiluteum TaxID=2812559 RepID=UPI001A9703B4|nr:EAL domain-containing protein [Arenibaculum pallidiluteum]